MAQRFLFASEFAQGKTAWSDLLPCLMLPPPLPTPSCCPWTSLNPTVCLLLGCSIPCSSLLDSGSLRYGMSPSSSQAYIPCRDSWAGGRGRQPWPSRLSWGLCPHLPPTWRPSLRMWPHNPQLTVYSVQCRFFKIVLWSQARM